MARQLKQLLPGVGSTGKQENPVTAKPVTLTTGKAVE
jgi:hypothetical protein